jgi:hypothetical protein
MDAPPPTSDRRRFGWTFWLTVAFLFPASILTVVTVEASLGCLGATEAVLLFVLYAVLFALAWLVRHAPAAAAAVAICTAVATAVPLTLGLQFAAHGWPNIRGFWCSLHSDLATGCFVGAQFILATAAAVVSLFLWDSHRLRTGQTRGW